MLKKRYWNFAGDKKKEWTIACCAKTAKWSDEYRSFLVTFDHIEGTREKAKKTVTVIKWFKFKLLVKNQILKPNAELN